MIGEDEFNVCDVDADNITNNNEPRTSICCKNIHASVTNNTENRYIRLHSVCANLSFSLGFARDF